MKQYMNNYLDFINKLRTEYDNKVKALKADDRVDEAILYKVRINICDIFSQVANATEKKVTALKIVDEQEQIRKYNEEYMKWFEKIPESWQASMEQAKQFNDAVTVKTEEVKLDTVDILCNQFLKVAGEAGLKTE